MCVCVCVCVHCRAGRGPGSGWALVFRRHSAHPHRTAPSHRARMSAAQCLAHPWLNNLAEKAKRCNRRLKSQILLKKYLMKRRWKVPLDTVGRREGLQAGRAPGTRSQAPPALPWQFLSTRPSPVWKTGLAFLSLSRAGSSPGVVTLHPPPRSAYYF